MAEIPNQKGEPIQKFDPELILPLENIVPSPLHIMLGLASDYLKAIEKYVKNTDSRIYDRLQRLLNSFGVYKNAWTQSLVGR